jgi:hypothetical protein
MYYHKEMNVVKKRKWVIEIKFGQLTEVVGSRTNQNDLKSAQKRRKPFSLRNKKNVDLSCLFMCSLRNNILIDM